MFDEMLDEFLDRRRCHGMSFGGRWRRLRRGSVRPRRSRPVTVVIRPPDQVVGGAGSGGHRTVPPETPGKLGALTGSSAFTRFPNIVYEEVASRT